MNVARIIRHLGWIGTTSLVLLFGCEKSAVEFASPANENAKSGNDASIGRGTAQTIPSWAARPVIQIESDSCELLTGREIEQLQGTAVRETKGSGSTDGRVQALQCYYLTVDPNLSVSLTVMKDDPSALGQNGARNAWNRSFRRHDKDAEEHQQLGENAAMEEEEEERRPIVPVSKVDGLGEKAFWVGSHAGPSLHVLKGNVYLRLSVSGADDDDVRLAKSKTLAQKALDRL